jgi:radial spoke head protein 4A
VHHVPYILPQGRVSYEAPKELKDAENDEEEKEDEEEADEENGPEPETGPAVLNPVNSDEGILILPRTWFGSCMVVQSLLTFITS